MNKQKLSYCHEDLEQGNSESTFIIGDSISIGYEPFVINAVHSPCNARYSGYAVDNLHEWLNQWNNRSWKICTFNHGIHDLADVNFKGIDDYLRNLSIEINILKSYCEKIMFVSSTKIPESSIGFHLDQQDEYNTRAIELMNDLSINVCRVDLITVDDSEKDGLHFTENGYKRIGNKINECLEVL